MKKNIIYLIHANNTDRYKIGITSSKNLNNRLKNLQTGCSDQLIILKTYITEYASLIEKTLHRELGIKQVHGEWFELNINDVLTFESRCSTIEKNINLLKNQNNDYILKILKV
jgi:hypothetical protein